jgi:hypothetical protein
MGGRKSYSIKKVVGPTKKIQKERRQLRESLEIGDPKGIVKATVDIVKSSDFAVGNLVHTITFLSIIQEFEKKPITENLKQEVVKRWTELKKEKKIETEPEIDRLLIESAIKTLARRGKND